MKNRTALVIAFMALCSTSGLAVELPPTTNPKADLAATLARVRNTAMSSDWAWQRLEELTDRIGPRPAGSAGQAAAIAQVAAAMRALGAQVTLQPTKVPHWVRGDERGELTEYPGRPAGLKQVLHLTALGASGATPKEGLEAPVIVIHDFDHLHTLGAQVRGKIVLFESRFDQRLAENGQAGVAYMQSGQYRVKGPAEAAALGAVAVLVRSIGGADYRLPHTGVTRWNDHQAPVPAAALSTEDADLVFRLAAQGPVSLKLWLTPVTLPDADSFNVIADWPGTEKPSEVVIVSGHLDSWDLGTGATDDGIGVMAAAGVLRVMQELQVHARRTMRFVGWADEENGGHGPEAYMKSADGAIANQCAAIESDLGAGRAIGIEASVEKSSLAALAPVIGALGPLGATVLQPHEGEVGSDIGPLQEAGVPGFAPMVDTRHYFDYHHTAADTLDKVDPYNLKSQVATMAALAYFLADSENCLPRVPAAKK